MLVYKAKKAPFWKASWLSIVQMVLFTFYCITRYLLLPRHKASRQVTDAYSHFWSGGLLAASHTSIELSGFENLQPGQSYLYMANHRSLFDIPVLLYALPPSTRMLSKVQVTKFPIFGRAMLKAGFLAIDRQNREKAIKQLEGAKQHMREGISLCVFPEGTRNRNEGFLPFKKGVFHLAIDLEAMVVPVFVRGADDVVPTKRIILHHNKTVSIMIGKPISTANLAKNELESLMEKTYTAMLELKDAAL